MRPGQRFTRLAGLAAASDARALPVGDGGIEVLHKGQRIALRNLAELARWLLSVNPSRAYEIGLAAKRTAAYKRHQRGEARKRRRHA